MKAKSKWVPAKYTGILVYRHYRCRDCKFEKDIHPSGNLDNGSGIKCLDYKEMKNGHYKTLVIRCPKCNSGHIYVTGAGVTETFTMNDIKDKVK